MQEITNTIDINSKIYNVRGKQVMLDRDLAELYGVENKRLNEQVKRNIERFPEKFRFQLTHNEYLILRSQFATLRLDLNNEWGKHVKYLPYVFTEQGVSMLSAVLKSKTAIDVSIKIIDSFVNMRKTISKNTYILNRIEILEQNQLITNTNFDKVFKALENKDITYRQGIFYNKQIFDAHNFISDLIRKAKNHIILIDNYIDDTTLLLFSKNQKIKITIYTSIITEELKLDLEKYNKQYNNIIIKTNKKFHDRFLIIDEKEVYHIGASLKDLGKKVFAFSKMEDLVDEVLKKLV